VEHVLALLVLGVLVLTALVWGGARLLWAGRQLDVSSASPTAPEGTVAAKVDARLGRTRAAVETLVMPEVEPAELEPMASSFAYRAQTYVVLGLSLLGLAATLVVGFLLLL
jgi:hypothetical protein